MLLDTIEQTYFAFRSRVRDIRHATTCDCKACERIPSLDLKFLVHHGRFVRQQVASGEELTGTDVVLVHRLLKNSVAEQLDLRGYAFYTEDCIDALAVEPGPMALQPHRERYEDVGEVAGYVEDLEARWQFEDERRRVYVVPADAELDARRVLPAPVPVVWEFVTAPQKRQLWGLDVVSIDEEASGGRRGVGTTTHCVHGQGTIVEEILDWRPFRYFTHRRVMPLLGAAVFTWELRPKGDYKTEISARVARLRGFKQR
jgi:hypothetical protein